MNSPLRVIAGPTLANIDRLDLATLRRHARSLENYGWRVFDQLARALDLADELGSKLAELANAREAGDDARVATLLDEIVAQRRLHAVSVDPRREPGGHA